MDEHSLRVLEFPEIRRILDHYAGCSLARLVIEHLVPSSDPARLALSLRQVDEARSLLDAGHGLPVGGLTDMAAVIASAHQQNRAMDPEELLLIVRCLRACEALDRAVAQHRETAPTLAELAGRMLDHREVAERIEFTVEPPGEVTDRASPKLWELRRRRRELEEKTRARMDELVQDRRYRPFLQERTWSVRNGRHVLLVKLDSRGHVPGILHDKSASGETAFVEPQEIVALANEMADVRLDEGRERSRILLELSRQIYGEEKRLAYTQNVAAWLAFTAARAHMSQDLGLVPARLSADGAIRLRGARHPMLLWSRRHGQLGHDVVPITVSLGESFRTLVVTGPNTGGKTVVLKTVGLIQLMFQAGLHVPGAPGTELPCLDGVFADIGDEQSLTQSLSTFSGHVANIVNIFRSSGPRSLVLLDELGAGTDPEEGAALGEAILDRLGSIGGLVLVTTHLGSLKAFGFSRPGVENASMTFDEETLSPTFQLLVGQPGTSQALAIARRHGMPAEVVDQAAGLTSRQHGETVTLMDQLSAARVAAERSRQESADLVQTSRERLTAAESALAEAEAARDRIEREAESELQQLVDHLESQARPHLNALKNVPRSLLPHVEGLERVLADRPHVQAFSDRRRAFLAGIKRHDEVYVPRFQQVCRVEKLHKGEERLTVRVGGLSMQIGFDDVSWVTPPDARRDS